MPPTRTPPPPTSFLQISYPAERVVLATMSREKDLNCMNTSAQWEMDAFWKWLDNEPSLSVAIITGAGKKAFSAGADLKEWNDSMKDEADPRQRLGNALGFKPLSRRLGKKPVIAAVNGLAMGAGTEFAVNWYVSRSWFFSSPGRAVIQSIHIPLSTLADKIRFFQVILLSRQIRLTLLSQK
jgi:1,4-dihydroxy-2-naphthoyl-CoA synthase